MDVGNCSETDGNENSILSAFEIYFPWGHGARRFVSMVPVFLSAALILAKTKSSRWLAVDAALPCVLLWMYTPAVSSHNLRLRQMRLFGDHSFRTHIAARGSVSQLLGDAKQRRLLFHPSCFSITS